MPTAMPTFDILLMDGRMAVTWLHDLDWCEFLSFSYSESYALCTPGFKQGLFITYQTFQPKAYL